jgi:hypothetical protein
MKLLHSPLGGLWNIMGCFQKSKTNVLFDNQLHQNIGYQKYFDHSFNLTFVEVPIF